MNRLWLITKISIRKIFRLQVALLGLFLRNLSHAKALFLGVLLSGCTAKYVAPDYDKMLLPFKNQTEVVQTEHFKHLVISNSLALDASHQADTVVVFIEGDGLPWMGRYRVSPDPTSENALLLGWFESSPFHSVYLGRPCYFDLEDPVCEAYWYTHGRYSETVVESLQQALAKSVEPLNRLVLVGHSGGGALAALLAERLENVAGVVTVSGNLNVDAWISENRYSALRGSLDPSGRPPLSEEIKQIHYYSYGDSVIHADWIIAYAASQSNAELQERGANGHSSAWRPFRDDVFEQIRELIERP